MAFSDVKGLFKNIEESVTSNPFKGNSLKLYPKEDSAINKVITVVKPENWTAKLPYSFSVKIDGGATDAAGFGEFVLPLNPQEINQKEKFAIKMRATQGGTTVNHNGNKYKELEISGTTGIHPFRGAGGASARTGKAILQPDSLKYRSGYEVFQELRNFFKAYYEFKKTNPAAKTARLIFNNFKDSEFLQVEVIDFTMSRAAANGPKLYKYKLSLKVLAPDEAPKIDKLPGIFGALENFDTFINTAVDLIDTSRGIFLRSQDILNQISSTYENTLLEPLRKASLAGKAFLGAANTLADFGPGLIRTTVSAGNALAILARIRDDKRNNGNTDRIDPRIRALNIPNNLEKAVETQGSNILLNLNGGSGEGADALQAIGLESLSENAIRAFDEQIDQSLDLPREFYENAIEQLLKLEADANDKFNLGDPDFDELYDRIPTLVGDLAKGATDREIEVLDGFRQAILGMHYMISTTALFQSGYSNRIDDVNSRFAGGLGLSASPAVKEIIIPAGVDLDRIAFEQLGSSSRWIELVELNELKPPFLVQDRSELTASTRAPGDKLLIPQPIISGFGNTETVKELALTAGLNATERNLGIDFALTDEFDLELTNSNDIALRIGIDNAKQAILLKLFLERGDLLDHPGIGLGLQPGTKIGNLNDVRRQIVQTLEADPRFESVQNLTIEQENSTLNINFLVNIKNVDTPVPVSIKFPARN